MDSSASPNSPETAALYQELERIQDQAVAYARDLSQAYHAERARSRELAEALETLWATYETTLGVVVRALDARDTETQDHSERVVHLTLALAKEIGVEESLWDATRLGALLHDVGKIGVPDAILRKPGPLSPEEWDVMRKHPELGYLILYGVGFLRDAAQVVLHHHERFDGKGYPAGLCGTEIHFGARIFAVADAFDAITSDRPYRKARTRDVAMAEIVRHSGSQFDPEAVEAMLSVFARGA